MKLLYTFADQALDTAKKFNEMLNKTYTEDAFAEPRKSVISLGQAGYRLVITIAVSVFVLSLIVGGVMLTSSNSKTREEGKNKVTSVILAVLGVFNIASIITIIMSLVGSLA